MTVLCLPNLLVGEFTVSPFICSMAAVSLYWALLLGLESDNARFIYRGKGTSTLTSPVVKVGPTGV
jgi:hypothetical protein